MIKKIAFSLGLFALAISTAGSSLLVKTAHAVTNPLIISAVQTTGGEGKTGEDFVEIYNPNSEAFNLNGYRLVKRSAAGTTDSAIKSWSSDTFIPAYSFYLWANSGFTGISSVPDTTTSSTLADNNGVALRFGANDTGTLVDSLSWGTTTNEFTSSGLDNPAAGQSIVKSSLFESSGYGFAVSAPRNSTKQVMPADPQLPETPEVPGTLIDNSSCAIVDTEQSAENLKISSVVFTNTGNNPWINPNYSVDSVNSDDVLLGVNQSILPGGTLSIDLQIPIPSQGGKHTYEWQMAKSNVKFGQKCIVELNFKDVANQTPEEETTEQPQEETPEEQPETPTDPQSDPNAISITELLINPDGKDDGAEAVELYNSSDEKINLSNWVLDDIADGEKLTSDKYVLSNLEIEGKSYLAVTLPAGKAVLNNTKGDVMSIVDSSGKFIDTVTYVVASSPEAKSYSLIDGEWQWASTSLGKINVADVIPEETEEETPESGNVKIEGLEISEIYPAPSKGDSEFIELYNDSNKTIDLSKVILKVGDKTKTLPSINLLAGKYLALKDNQLSLALLDKGAKVELLQLDGTSIFDVTYEKSTKGQSYSKIDDKFTWTSTPTPGEANKLTAIPEVVKDKTVITKKTTVTTKTTPNKTTTTKKTVIKKTTPTVVKSSINHSLPKENNLISTSDSSSNNDAQNKQGKNSVNLIAMVLASLGAGSLAIYKFGFGGF